MQARLEEHEGLAQLFRACFPNDMADRIREHTPGAICATLTELRKRVIAKMMRSRNKYFAKECAALLKQRLTQKQATRARLLGLSARHAKEELKKSTKHKTVKQGEFD